jgi:cob(I)alamin adenosyltransferase
VAGVKIYTRHGDDGTTSLRVGGRVRKDDLVIELVGTVDEAQAALGVARAEVARGEWLDTLLIEVERDLWVLMAEVTTERGDRDRLEAGTTAVTQEMVANLEARIDASAATIELAPAFSVPGATRVAALLDLARTVVRRAERLAVALNLDDSEVVTYLNRLSDLCWTLARTQEDEHPINHRAPRSERGGTSTVGAI